MKGFLAGFTGGLLLASLMAAPLMMADENGVQDGRYDGSSTVSSTENTDATVTTDVETVTNEDQTTTTVEQTVSDNGNGDHAVASGDHPVGNGYSVNVNGERVAWPTGGVMVAEPGGMYVSQNGRVYYVNDDPRYDLSGAGKTLVLADDGGSYKSESGTVPASALGGARKEVVSIPSEYQQHWLAVAAGDRPVRHVTSVPTAPQGPTVTFMPVYFSRASRDEDGRTAYTNGTAKRTNGTYKGTSARKANGYHKKNGYRKTSTATVASRNGNGYRNGSAYRNGNGYRNGATATTADASTRTRVGATYAKVEDMTRNLYQVGHSWYLLEGDTWSRSDTWRGPFVTVSDGTVPREVKLAEKEPFQD
jgi:hypothetical protein